MKPPRMNLMDAFLDNLYSSVLSSEIDDGGVMTNLRQDSKSGVDLITGNQIEGNSLPCTLVFDED